MHSALSMPLKIYRTTTLGIQNESYKAKFVRSLRFLIIDEISMMTTDQLNAIDRSFRSIRQS
jgi:hypothetical protein